MGKFIVIEGTDGSGKETQAKLLCDDLALSGKKVRYISFPCYESDSSFAVRKYLSGELGENPDDTNAYAASMFFATDRYISFVTDWKKDISDPETIVVANRYTTANAVHQLAKLPRYEWNEFIVWLRDFEFGKLALPRPDLVIYLDVPNDVSEKLIEARTKETGRGKDIHESDISFLRKSHDAAIFASSVLGWRTVRCAEKGVLRSRADIHSEIMEKIGDV